MQEAKEIRLIFDAGAGKVDLSAITAVCGDRVGAMPRPTRRGYLFAGWYTAPEGGERISSETVVSDHLSEETRLYAHWKKPDPRQRKKSSLRTQKNAIWILAAAIIFLAVGVIVSQIIISIYHYEDVDGTVYAIKKMNGVYGLYYIKDDENGKRKGDKCDINDDGYYLTAGGTQLSLDTGTGEYTVYAVVDTEGTEVVGYGQRVLLFKQLTYDKSSTTDYTRVIDRIEVHNAYGTMILKRGSDESNRFQIEGHEGTIFSDELFAQLSVGCGYTISMQRLENPVRLPDGSIDFAEYGLAPEVRELTDENGQTVTDEDGQIQTYDYTPAWYTVSTLQPDRNTGLDRYTVTIGDATVSGAGYYARYEDRNTVYILSATNLDAAVLCPIETLVTPMLVYPMTMNSYFDVENFVLRGQIDYERLYLYMAATLVGIHPSDIDLDHPDDIPADVAKTLAEALDQLSELEEEAFSSLYERALKASSRVITGFSYIDMGSRENTLYASIPYKMATDYMAGYLPNADNISAVLQKLYAMEFDGVMVLGPDEEELEAYGLSEPAFLLSFLYHDTDGGEHSNLVNISAKTEDGKYYAYSPYFDMIVCLDENQAPFLEWELIDWYEREYYQYNIAFVRQVVLEGAAVSGLGDKYLGADGRITFTLDNSASDQSDGINSSNLKVFINGSTVPVDYTLTVTKPSGSQAEETGVYNFRRFMQSMLTASIEGVADLTTGEMETFRNTPDGDCQLKMSIFLDDGKGNTLNLVYRFYRYTERRSFMTIEVLPTATDSSAPQNGQGIFYVLRSFCDKMVADAARFIDHEEIHPDSKN